MRFGADRLKRLLGRLQDRKMVALPAHGEYDASRNASIIGAAFSFVSMEYERFMGLVETGSEPVVSVMNDNPKDSQLAWRISIIL